MHVWVAALRACRMLVFYTYSGDGEAAEISRAQHAIVPFAMQDVDESFVHPRNGTVSASHTGAAGEGGAGCCAKLLVVPYTFTER